MSENMKKKIVVMEDERPIRRGLEKFLQRQNYEVFSAEEGEKALAFIKNQDADLLITDINVPEGMGGEQLIKQLKESKIPIIVISGYLENECLAEKVAHFIKKPFLFDEISSKVTDCLTDDDELELKKSA